jgi:hypothetical protein
VLSWSFFVLCTPVADGGFIVAFPVRLLFGTRMLITQAIVWLLAVAINVLALNIVPSRYDGSALTKLLYTILTTPIPYWSILAIALAGTGLSIWFGDEMMDVTTHADRKHHHKHGFKLRVVIVVGLGVLTILAYYQLLSSFGVNVPTG